MLVPFADVSSKNVPSIEDGGDNNEVLLGSLELSVTPSQSVDGKEPVTQEEDVPYQLLAEKEKVAGKIARAFVRRKGKTTLQGADIATGIVPVIENMSKALVTVMERKRKAVHDISASTVDVSLDMGANVASSPVSPTKIRVAVAKKKLKTDPAASPLRSPRVSCSSVDGSTRHSSRILEQKKASPLAQGKSTSSKVKQVGSSVFLLSLLIEVPFVFVYV